MSKNKFKEILTISDSNKFGHKNKIGEFKYIDIKDLVNNIKDNTISEIDAKKRLNTLNKIKKCRNKTEKAYPWTKGFIKLIRQFVRYNFNWYNTNVIKRWKWKIKCEW